MTKQKKNLTLTYYDAYGILVGSTSTFLKNEAIPTAHLKNLIHRHLPYGYKIMNNFAYPQSSNYQDELPSEIYVAVKEEFQY